jgi:hypothetical protein
MQPGINQPLLMGSFWVGIAYGWFLYIIFKLEITRVQDEIF